MPMETRNLRIYLGSINFLIGELAILEIIAKTGIHVPISAGRGSNNVSRPSPSMFCVYRG